MSKRDAKRKARAHKAQAAKRKSKGVPVKVMGKIAFYI